MKFYFSFLFVQRGVRTFLIFHFKRLTIEFPKFFSNNGARYAETISVLTIKKKKNTKLPEIVNCNNLIIVIRVANDPEFSNKFRRIRSPRVSQFYRQFPDPIYRSWSEKQRERENRAKEGGEFGEPITELKNFRTSRVDLFPIQRIVFRGFSKNSTPRKTGAKRGDVINRNIVFPAGHPSSITTHHHHTWTTIMARDRSKKHPLERPRIVSPTVCHVFPSVFSLSTSWFNLRFIRESP